MKRLFLKVAMGVLVFLLSTDLLAQTALDVMKKVEKAADESYSSSIQKMTLSTCKYGTKNKRIVCAEKPRVKVIESIQKETGPTGKGSKSVSIILEPISEKGVGMLSYDYEDPDKDADNWLYLSALGKVKRMVSGSDDDEESEGGSFFGTEFSVDDMETSDLEDYTYKILKEGTYQKRPVWVIESVPTVEHARKTPYGKTVTWIDKERLISMRVLFYNRRGELRKKLSMRKITRIDGYWIAKQMTMNNVRTNRVTNMTLSSISFNIDIPDDFLTQRTLTDFAYRERELAKLRQHLK